MWFQILRQVALGLWGIAPGNYSGITHIQGNEYAVCDDKDCVDGFKLLTLDVDSVTGKIRHAAMHEPQGMKGRRAAGVNTQLDCEGIAYFPDRHTLFVSGEEQQRILEYSLDGVPTGRELNIPREMQRDRITPNRGFEALTYNASTGLFWTTTESVLPADIQDDEDSRCQPLRFVAFDKTLQPVGAFVYRMDARMAKTGKSLWGRQSGTHVHGVPSMVALDDGRLIVMEREACMNRKAYASWVRIKLYLVDATQMAPLQTPTQALPHPSKTLLCSFVTRLRLGMMNLSNYEGMCLGPRLADGRQTLILIADSQNGAGNRLFRIKDYVRVITFRL